MSSRADAWLVGVSLAQGLLTIGLFALLASRGVAGALVASLVFGLGLCWCSNTVSHNHLHNPIFRSQTQNGFFSLYLTLLLGVPQSVWKARHLWHHAGEPDNERPLFGALALFEVTLIAVFWALLAWFAPRVLLTAYLPGYALGMLLCVVQGRAEHGAREVMVPGVSCYGRIHNFLWFNDGYHAEHHRWPGEHWTRLPERRGDFVASESRWPPLLRGFGGLRPRFDVLRGQALCLLERMVLASVLLQRLVIGCHERALRQVLQELLAGGFQPDRVGIIGGGLFPRSALILARIFPKTRLVVIDSSERSVRVAREFLERSGSGACVEFVVEAFDAERHAGFDLLVVPLGFVGESASLSSSRERCPVLIHDWIWQKRSSRTKLVSMLLLKRLNLMLPDRFRSTSAS